MVAKKIALFIDADNISAKYGKQIFAAIESRGEVFIRRIYGNWEKNSLHGWNECILNFSLRAIQQPDFVTGKNATDMCLTIDAMDVLHEGKAEIFALVSNDSDFTPLVIRLREGGMTIIGLGNANASNAFRAACNEFIDLDASETVKPAQKSETPPASPITAAVKNTTQPVKEIVTPVQMSLFTENPAPVEPERPKSSKVVSITRATDIQSDDKIQTLHNILHETAKTHADSNGFVAMCWAGQSIHEHLNFSVKDFGYGSLYKFVGAFPDLYEVIHRDNGDNFCYRCRTNKPTTPAKQSTTSAKKSTAPVKKPTDSAKQLQKFHDAICEATTAHADDSGFVNLSTVGTFINSKKLGFGVKDLGYGKLQKFIAAFPDRYEMRKEDNETFLRCRGYEQFNKLHELLRETAAARADDTGFTDLSYVGNSIGKQKIGFGIRSLGYGTLQKFVAAFPDRYEIRKTDKKVFYRCRVEEPTSVDDRLNRLHDIIREAATAYQDDDGFSLLNHAGQQIKRKNLNFSVKDFGYGQLREFISAFPDRYEVAHDSDGGKFRYRCKQI